MATELCTRRAQRDVRIGCCSLMRRYSVRGELVIFVCLDALFVRFCHYLGVVVFPFVRCMGGELCVSLSPSILIVFHLGVVFCFFDSGNGMECSFEWDCMWEGICEESE